MNAPNNNLPEVIIEDVEAIPVMGIAGQIDRAQVDVQIATAKRYPRSVDRALKEAVSLATADEETARGMGYQLPRQTTDGKPVKGPSVRLAEIMVYTWGNLRAESYVADIDGEFVSALGTCFDLERNVAVRVMVKRRITDKKGVRYGADMIGVTSNAAIAIAFRNAVFKAIPRAYANRVYNQAMKAAVGPAETFKAKRENAVGWFEEKGMKRTQVFQMLDVHGVDDINSEHLLELFGIKTAIEDGETSIADIIRRLKGESEGAEALNRELGSAPAAKPAPKDDAKAADLRKDLDQHQQAKATTKNAFSK